MITAILSMRSNVTLINFNVTKCNQRMRVKIIFPRPTAGQFYSSVPALTYPAFHKHASRMASLFGSTYICETTFSVINFNKSKWRTTLTDEHLQSILQFSTTQYTPRYDKLIGEESQMHTLH